MITFQLCIHTELLQSGTNVVVPSEVNIYRDTLPWNRPKLRFVVLLFEKAKWISEPISLMIIPLKFKFDGSSFSLSSEIWLNDRNENVHMSW